MTTAVSTLAPRARRKMQARPPADPITQYALDVLAGRVVAGTLVHKACERHITDLATGAERGLHFDAEAGMKAVEFFGVLRHYKGDLGKADGGKGAFVHLEPWQVFIVGSLFGWKREDGMRRFRRFYVEVAKKNGKTLMGAGLMLLLTFFDGEPGAEGYSLATKEAQAKLTWADGAQFVKRSPEMQKRIRQIGNRLVCADTASFWTVLGRDSDTGDQGINAHSGLIDELHVIDNPDTIDNLETATSARSQPIVGKITTAGVKGKIVWEGERKDAVAVVEGRATDDAMLVLIFTLDEGDDPFDEAVWPKSNPNLGVSVRLDTLREQAETAKRSPGKLAAYLRYRMNVATSVSSAAIDIDEWDKGSDEPVIPEDATVDAGLDLASVRDLTALVWVHLDEDGWLNIDGRFWCPEDGIRERSRRDGVPYEDWVRDGYLVATPGNVTDYDFVREEVRALADRQTVREIAYDRWNATQLATSLTSDGATMVPVPQTHAGLGPGWRELEKAILEHKIRHGGNPVLRWMAGNVEVETDAAGNQKPSKARSSERIDGMVALDMAVGRLITHVVEDVVEPAVLYGRAR
jgi:phage terminase large subunit-like protein